MYRYLFAFFLGFHGFGHMTGFGRAANPATVDSLLLPVSKGFGSLWMIAAFLFIAAAGMYLSRKEWWWLVALAGVTLSQYLVIIFWADAKFATLFNLIVLVAAVIGCAQWRFRRAARRELSALHAGLGNASAIVDTGALEALPSAVARWLERAGVVGRPLARTVHLRQSGELRTTPDGKWMPLSAEQWFTAERPGFLWLADVSVAPGVHFAGLDTYRDGRGHMLIKAMSVRRVTDGAGPEVDQGALVRFLAEMVWVPSAALRSYVTWREVDESTATATITAGGQTVSARFRFNAAGDPAAVEAERYFLREGGAALERWHVTLDPDSYRTFEEIRLPTKATVTWKLADGDFEWYRVQLDAAMHNRGLKI